MRIPVVLLFLLLGFVSAAQPNCEAYKYQGDTLKCTACHVAEERAGHYQFSREYQEACDRALAVDSTFGYAYKIKSTAYLKSGDMITFMELMNKAVELNPKEYLSYRGWCRYQFFRDYRGAIDDIEAYDALVDYDLGPCQTGDYHLNIARAICYKALGERTIAIEIIESEIAKESYYQGLYDYLHLAVLYYEIGEFEKAMDMFEIQAQHNDMAENDYYKSLTLAALGNRDKALEAMQVAHEKYKGGHSMHDSYAHHMDKVFLDDIERELKLLE